MRIGYCRGCGVCNRTHKCVQNDDMAAVLDKMVAADVIVMATPVYFYSMNGQLKTLIDRTVPRYEEIRGKDFIILSRPPMTIGTICAVRLKVFGLLPMIVLKGQEKKALFTASAPGRSET